MKRIIPVILAVLAVFAATPLFAARSKTTTFTVTAGISGNCVISAVGISFGDYDAVSANATSPLTGTGSIAVQCTKGASATIDLNGGANASGGVRRMIGGSDYLQYGIYQDAAYTTAWGTGVTGGTTETYNSTSTLTTTTLTMYGSVPPGQGAGINSLYTDTVTVTINY